MILATRLAYVLFEATLDLMPRPCRVIGRSRTRSLRRSFFALAVCVLHTGAYAQETVLDRGGGNIVREGYLAHEGTDGEHRLFYFSIFEDGSVALREGTDEAAPTITVPRLIVHTLGEQVEAQAPSDTDEIERLAVAVDEKAVWVRWAKKMDLLLVLSVGALLAGLFVASGGWVWVRRERRERLRMAESRAHLAVGQEAERARLAHEIHDGSLQDLSGILRRVGSLRMSITRSPTAAVPNEAGAITEEIEEDLRGVAVELRAIMADLQPPALGAFGVGAAIRAHTDRFRVRYPALDTDLDLVDDEPELPNPLRLALFRICQEAMSNAARHAGANNLSVRLSVEKEEVVLQVTDDGAGFATPAAHRHFVERGNYGLSNMKARAEAAGARLDVDSTPGTGTTVRVAAPLPEPRGDGTQKNRREQSASRVASSLARNEYTLR